MKTDLTLYNNSWYQPGSRFRIFLWMITSFLFFRHNLAVFNQFKCILLRLFGAKIGKGVIIKPCVTIKYPWFLEIGNNSWIGEKVWIDNLAKVEIGNNVCISQGALLLTGNHDYSRESFDLTVRPIILEEGVWIGARAIVCPGIRCESNSVLTVASVANCNLTKDKIFKGNPAIAIKDRAIYQVI